MYDAMIGINGSRCYFLPDVNFSTKLIMLTENQADYVVKVDYVPKLKWLKIST